MTWIVHPDDRRAAAEAATWDDLDALRVAACAQRAAARTETDEAAANVFRARGSSLSIAVSTEAARRLRLAVVAPELRVQAVRAYALALDADALERAELAVDATLGDQRWRDMPAWRDIVRTYPRGLRRAAWRAALEAVALAVHDRSHWTVRLRDAARLSTDDWLGLVDDLAARVGQQGGDAR